MIATNAIGSGQIAADVTLRDKTLVQAQNQIDQLAASMASALSDNTTAGTAAPAALAPKAGFDLDLSNVLPGNTINLTYTDTATNTQHQVTIVRVDDPTALPLSNPGADPNDQVIGVNFSGGMASIVAQLSGAVGGSNLQFSNPSGSTLRVVDNGTNGANVNAASVTTTIPSLANGSLQLPLFTDGSSLYTGRDYRIRLAADRLCWTHHNQSRAARRSFEAHGLQYLAPDQCRRHDAHRFPLFTADLGHLHLFAADRAWHPCDTVQGNALRLHAAVPQPAEQCVYFGDAACPGSGCRGQHAAAEIQIGLRASTSTPKWPT